MDKGLQKEILGVLDDLKTSNEEAQKKQTERLDKVDEKLAEFEEKVGSLETSIDKPERKVKPLHWDYEDKEVFGKWLIDRLQNKTSGNQDGTNATAGPELVPDDFVPEIWRIVGEKSLALQLARIIPTVRDTVLVPYAGTTAAAPAWENDTAASDESKVTFGQASISIEDLTAYSDVSNDLIADAGVDVVDYLVELFTEAIGEEIDNQVFAGTGTPVSGLVGANGTYTGYSVCFDSGSLSWSQLDAKYLSEMISKVKPSVLSNAVFIMHPTALHYVRILKDDNNHPIYQFPNQPGPGAIYGYPVYTTTKMPSTTTGASKPMAVFGNFKQGYCIAKRQDITVTTSPHYHFIERQTVILYLMRLGLARILANCFVALQTAAS